MSLLETLQKKKDPITDQGQTGGATNDDSNPKDEVKEEGKVIINSEEENKEEGKVVILSEKEIPPAEQSQTNEIPPAVEVGKETDTITFDENSIPFLAFSDQGASNKASVMKFNGATWVNVGAAGFSQAEAVYTSLAIHNGTPYVAFRDSNAAGKATVMKFNGATWVNVGSAGFSTGDAESTSLKIDDNGTLYVAFRDGNVAGKATVMKFDGTNWVTVGSAGF